MDAAFDCAEIKNQSEKLGHTAIIDTNQRRDKPLKNEAARQRYNNLKKQNRLT